MVDVELNAENITQLRVLRRGDHIAVRGEMAGMPYYHHGIFLGHSIGVADFGGTVKSNTTIRIIDIFEFTDYGKRQLIRYIYKSTDCLSAEEAAINAERLAVNPRMWGAYDLLKNNCEHFATRCKIGRPVSFQVLKKLREVFPIIALVAGGASASSCVSGIGGSVAIGLASCAFIAGTSTKQK